MNRPVNNIISNISKLKSNIVRYVVNNHRIKINNSEFYTIMDDVGDTKWFLTCSYQGEMFALPISSEQSITVDMVRIKMKEMVKIIVDKIQADEATKNPPSQQPPQLEKQENK